METQPGGEGISVLDTDLEVDFAAPVGYVEPERPKPPPPPTMASKLNIDVNASTPGSSRPSSALGGIFTGAGKNAAMSKGGDQWESFKGKGETLGGRKTKGKGISHRQVEEVTEGSKIIRTECAHSARIFLTILTTIYALQQAPGRHFRQPRGECFRACSLEPPIRPTILRIQYHTLYPTR